MASAEGVIICLDPGHGGSDTGVVGNGITESQYVYRFCRRLEKLVDALPGCSGVSTRYADVDPSLAERGHMSQAARATAVLCVHVNGYHTAELSGALAICLPNDPIAELMCRAFLQALPADFLPTQRRNPYAPIIADVTDDPKTHWLQRSRNVLVPHSHSHPVLLELGYATNPDNARLIQSAYGIGALLVASLASVSCRLNASLKKS